MAVPPKMTALQSGTESGIDWATCEAPLYGAVNGYVRIPAGHPWEGADYDRIDVEVHGGLTFGADGWIGFDTLHSWDYWPDCPEFMDTPHAIRWTRQMVVDETRALARKVAEATA